MHTELKKGHEWYSVTVSCNPMIVEMRQRPIAKGKKKAASVAVKKFKKGEKLVKAHELWKKHVNSGDSSSFIDLLVRELDMTKAGARTYAYIVRKEK